MDWYLSWQVDDYVELNDEQEVEFEQAIESFKAWHKTNELPRYQSLLLDIQTAVSTKDPILMETVFKSSRDIWMRSANYIAPNVALLLDKLSMEQKQQLLVNIKNKQQTAHEKWIEEREEPESDKLKDSIERLEEQVGQLSSQQKVRYSENWSKMQSTLEHRIESRENWLSQMTQALTANNKVDQLLVVTLLTDFNSYRSTKHQALITANQQQYLTFIMAELPQLTEKQQTKVLTTVNEYLEDITYLIEES